MSSSALPNSHAVAVVVVAAATDVHAVIATAIDQDLRYIQEARDLRSIQEAESSVDVAP